MGINQGFSLPQLFSPFLFLLLLLWQKERKTKRWRWRGRSVSVITAPLGAPGLSGSPSQSKLHSANYIWFTLKQPENSVDTEEQFTAPINQHMDTKWLGWNLKLLNELLMFILLT